MKTTTDDAKHAGYEVTEHIEYTRTIVPSSMRSTYWKYFGFPANNDNHILTRQKIICTLCNTAIAYNKNTSNLRTHLIARHQSVLLQMQLPQSGGDALRPATTKRSLEEDNATLPSSTRRKLSNLNFTTPHTTQNSMTKVADAAADDDDEDLYIADDFKDVLEEDDVDDDALDEVAQATEDQDPPQVVLDDDDVVELIDPAAAQSQLSEHFDDDFVQHEVEEDDDERIAAAEAESLGAVVAQPYTFVDIVPPTATASLGQQQPLLCGSTQPLGSEMTTLDAQNNREEAVIKMLIADLLPIGTVCGRGFQQMHKMRALLDKRVLETKISAQHAQMQRTINTHLAQISQKTAYSLSLECYTNLEHLDICDIYFNYVSNDVSSSAPELHSVLYHSGRCGDVDLTDLLQHFSLEHCAVIVVSGEAPPNTLFLEDFVNAHEIPTIECLESVLTRCLVQIFAAPEISAAFEEVYKLSEEVLLLSSMPEVYVNCPWSKLNYLKFALDNLVLHGLNEIALNDDMRSLVEYLQPLEIPLDTIAKETLPICSVIRPLMVLLYEEYFAVTSPSSYLSEARQIIETEFQKCIINNGFLHEATFFDARFRHYFVDADTSSNLQQAICLRFKRLLVLTKVPKPPPIKMELDSGGNAQGGKRKSSLKMFFARTAGHSNQAHTPPLPQKTTIDLEFDKYKFESELDLCQCPISWWRQQPTDGVSNYQQLRKLAAYYLCVPACANRLYRSSDDANERYAWRQKRAALRQGAAERGLWYLHYNREYCDKLSQALLG